MEMFSPKIWEPWLKSSSSWYILKQFLMIRATIIVQKTAYSADAIHAVSRYIKVTHGVLSNQYLNPVPNLANNKWNLLILSNWVYFKLWRMVLSTQSRSDSFSSYELFRVVIQLKKLFQIYLCLQKRDNYSKFAKFLLYLSLGKEKNKRTSSEIFFLRICPLYWYHITFHRVNIWSTFNFDCGRK